MKIKPLGDRVIVKPLEEKEVKKGGIIIPDTAKDKPQEGEVVAVGPGLLLDSGERMAPQVKVGDTVAPDGDQAQPFLEIVARRLQHTRMLNGRHPDRSPQLERAGEVVQNQVVGFRRA